MNFIKNLLLLCFFLNCSIFFGQERKDLSILSFESISDTINKYLDNNISKAVDASNAYILKAKREKDKKKEWQGIQALSSSYERNRDFDNAQKQFENALNFAQENKLEEEIVLAYVLGAQIQMGLTNASKALELLDMAQSLAERANNEFLKESVLQGISYILQMTGDIQKAIDIRKTAISIYKNKSLDSVYTAETKMKYLVNGYSELSVSFLKIKQADSAKHYAALISKMITPEDSCNQRLLYETKGEIDFF